MKVKLHFHVKLITVILMEKIGIGIAYAFKNTKNYILHTTLLL